MIPGISSGGGQQSVDLSAGPSTSGNIDQGFSFGGPTIYGSGKDDWKKFAVIGAAVVVGALLLSRKK